MADLARTPESFPPEVHASLAELRVIARYAKSKDDPTLRRATDDEIALSELLRRPTDCTAHSSRTGLACRKHRTPGALVCRRHGGSARQVQVKAKERLNSYVMPVLKSLYHASQQVDNEKTIAAAVKAGSDLLDRANIGALVQAKVRASKQQQQGGPTVQVNIGFLG